MTYLITAHIGGFYYYLRLEKANRYHYSFSVEGLRNNATPFENRFQAEYALAHVESDLILEIKEFGLA